MCRHSSHGNSRYYRHTRPTDCDGAFPNRYPSTNCDTHPAADGLQYPASRCYPYATTDFDGTPFRDGSDSGSFSHAAADHDAYPSPDEYASTAADHDAYPSPDEYASAPSLLHI